MPSQLDVEPPEVDLPVAAIQLNSGPDPAENLLMLTPLVERAAETGVALIALPEATMACVGTDPASVAQPITGPFATEIRRLAERLAVTIVVGMYEPAPDGRAYNTLLAVGSWGTAAYRKIHLFDALGSKESANIAPGHELVTFSFAGYTVGLATCYDVRFADQFAALGRAGAQLVVLPASWADGPGKAGQWDLLTRARAMDSQAWLLAAGQAWIPPKGSTPLGIGRSVLVDPMGTVRAQLSHEPGILYGEISKRFAQEARERLPIL